MSIRSSGTRRATSVHLHGSPLLPQYDGYATISSSRGTRTVHYDNPEKARTLWYHDHAVHHTDSNAYMGLAGQYHLHDAVESSLGLPSGPCEAPLTIRDVAFKANGDFLFDDHGESSLMGDVILANNVPWPVMPVERASLSLPAAERPGLSRSYLLSLERPSRGDVGDRWGRRFVPSPFGSRT